MKTIFLVMFCLGAAGIAAAAGDSVQLLPSPLELPRHIGPLEFTGSPHKYDQPGLGLSYQYNAEGLSLTVYVYDAGETDLPDGADTVVACREYELVKQGVEQSYQKVVLKSEQLARLSPPQDQPLIREALYEFERDNHPAISYVWITVAAKHFIKLRFSAHPRLRDELPDARRALLSALGDAIKAYLAPADPAAKKPGTSMTLYGDSMKASDDEMQAGILYLGLLGAFVDKTPQLVPVCGGEVVPGPETEASLYRALLSLDAAGAKSKFGKRIAEIDQAGFLEEFAWVDLHRTEWGSTPPDGLTLDTYAPWRKKHLKGFKAPRFGVLTIDHPRPLPLEPAQTP